MDDNIKAKIVEALSGSQIGAIVACALGVDLGWGHARFTSKAIITSDGYVQANFLSGANVAHHSAFVGSYDDLAENLRSVGEFLRLKVGIGEEDRRELNKAVLTDWIATDYRS